MAQQYETYVTDNVPTVRQRPYAPTQTAGGWVKFWPSADFEVDGILYRRPSWRNQLPGPTVQREMMELRGNEEDSTDSSYAGWCWVANKTVDEDLWLKSGIVDFC